MLSALQNRDMKMFLRVELQKASCTPEQAIPFRGGVRDLLSRVQGGSKTAPEEAGNGDLGTGRRFFIDIPLMCISGSSFKE